jgi:hypothetical protein
MEAAARGMTPDPRRRRATLERVRRRRVAKLVSASLTASVVLAGSYVAMGATGGREAPEIPVAGPRESGYDFTGEPGTYPTLARGTFRDATWTLELVEDPDAAHPEDTASDMPEVALWVDGTERGSFETYTEWRGIAQPFHTDLGDDAEFVIGMVTPSAARVTAELGDGSHYEAAIFDGTAAPLPDTSYYVAFLPPGAMGHVVARDGDDVPVGRASLDNRPLDRRRRVIFVCPSPPFGRGPARAHALLPGPTDRDSATRLRFRRAIRECPVYVPAP